jgi:hypothetical protein
MALLQTFDTLLTDTTTGGSLLVRTIPQSTLPEEYAGPDRDPYSVAQLLDVSVITDFAFAGSGLPRIIASMLAAPDLYKDVGSERFDRWWQSVLSNDPDLASFAETVAYRALIPAPTSPLDLKSLADIVTGSAVLIGLYQGRPALVASGLVGVVVVWAVHRVARGAGDALEDAGYEWTRKLFHLPDSRRRDK